MLIYSRAITKNANAFKNTGTALDLNLAASGGLEAVVGGVGIKASSVTDAMLAGGISFSKLTDAVNIGRLDQNETVVGKWDFATGVNIPTINGVDIATTADVSAASAGLSGKTEVRAMSAVNFDVTGAAQTVLVDGVTLVQGDRFLLTGQTNAIENGIWVMGQVTPTYVAPTRAADLTTGDDAAMAYVFVMEGTTYADQGWMCTSNAGTVVGTNAQVWGVFTRRTAYVNGDGLTLTGSTFAVDTTVLVGTGIESDGANNFRLATQGNGIAGGGGTTLSVQADITSAGDVAPVTVGVNGVGLNVTSLDGDHLIVDFVPGSWTPTSTGAPTSAASNDLAAQFKGLDNALAALAGSTVPAPEMHAITSADVTAKFFTLVGTPNSAAKVTVSMVGGIDQVNKQIVGTSGVTPDFDILNGNQLHFLNGTAVGLSQDIALGDVLQITFL